jgi:UDP-N-acetylglucosamine--N-acetylmuramyl-(pentapeptide) pyrophosphoryl-undecaprenol N-acetylglucosamine transferase
MKRIALTGGGTGGHLVIAQALKEAALKVGLEVYYFGSTYGQDQSWFEADSDFKEAYFFNTSGVVNKGKIGKIFALLGIAKAFFKARKLLKTHQIEAVISVGGYSAAPASFAATTLKIPFYIHEQNAAMGKLNRTLKPKADFFFSSYYENPMPYPVRETFFEHKRQRSEIKTLIFLGGSQGAKAINDLALSLAQDLKQKGIRIIHQCGKNNYESVKTAYEELAVDVELFAFSQELPKYLQQADLAVARAGAGTVWELTAMQLPAVFIPYPYAAGDHQAANAQSHVDAGASWMMRENEIETSKIIEIIDQGVAAESKKLATLIEPHGADLIIKKILEESL